MTLNPKIADFGLAKILDDVGAATQSGAILGTPSYMAPEQAGVQPGTIGPATDVYALGAILYELLTGRPPFKAHTPIDTLHQVLTEEPVSVSRLQPKVPRDLEIICLKCLEKEPHRRYASASELAHDLDRFLHERPIQARRTGLAERMVRWCRRNKSLASLVASVTFLLVASAIGAWVVAALWRHQRNEAIAARNQIAEAERQKTDKFWESMLAQAQASRRTDDAGRRFRSLEVIAQASRIRRHDRLRDEAIACLALADLRQVTDWQESHTMLGAGIDIDPAMERYAAHDATGDVIVRRTADNAVVAHLAKPGDFSFSHFWPTFSPDGRLIVGNYNLLSSGESRSVVWNLEDSSTVLDVPLGLIWLPDGRLLGYSNSESALTFYRPGSDTQPVHSSWTKPDGNVARISPGGRWVALFRSHADGIKVVDAATGSPVAEFAPTGGTRSCAWSPDERLLAAGGLDGRVYVWDMETRRPQAMMEGHQADVIDLRFHPGGHLVGSVSWDGTSRLWDPVTGRPLVRVQGSLTRFSSDGDRMGLQNGTQASVWQLTDGRECRTVAHGRIGNRTPGAKPGQISGVDFSADGLLLASAGNDGVRLWDVASCRELAHLPTDETNTVLFDRRVAEPQSKSSNPEPKATAIPELGGVVSFGSALKLSKESRLAESRMHYDKGDLLTYGSRGLLHWPMRQDNEIDSTLRIGPPQTLVVVLPGDGWFTASWQAGGDLLAVNSRIRGQVTLLDVARSDLRKQFKGDQQTLTTAISRDGRWVAAAYALASGVQVWSAETGERECLLRPGDRPNESTSVAFSPDGEWIVSGGQTEYRFWHVGSWQAGPTVRRDQAEGWPFPPAFTPDGRLVALPVSMQRISLFDPAANREIAALTPPDPQHINCLSFSPDGTRLAVTTNANTIQLWDLRAIRRQLADLGLDWDLAPYPTSAVDQSIAAAGVGLEQSSRWIRAELALGELQQPVATSEERARQAIAHFRRAVDQKPDDPTACNHLAWNYLTAPESLRNAPEALFLAQRAIEGSPTDANIRNTLGVAYYRAGRYHEAAETLRANLDRQEDRFLAFDLYFLAMSHYRLGDSARARDYYNWAERWSIMQKELSAQNVEELKSFSTEARVLLGLSEPNP